MILNLFNINLQLCKNYIINYLQFFQINNEIYEIPSFNFFPFFFFNFYKFIFPNRFKIFFLNIYCCLHNIQKKFYHIHNLINIQNITKNNSLFFWLWTFIKITLMFHFFKNIITMWTFIFYQWMLWKQLNNKITTILKISDKIKELFFSTLFWIYENSINLFLKIVISLYNRTLILDLEEYTRTQIITYDNEIKEICNTFQQQIDDIFVVDEFDDKYLHNFYVTNIKLNNWQRFLKFFYCKFFLFYFIFCIFWISVFLILILFIFFA